MEQKLKIVFAIRHGEYDENTMELNDHGKQQCRIIGQKIREMTPPDFIPLVLSSPRIRAKQTADIVAKYLGSQVQICEELQTDQYHDGDKVRKAVIPLTNGSPVLILVTHLDAPSGIINAFSQANFNKMTGYMMSKKGNGMMIDLSTGRIVSDLIRG